MANIRISQAGVEFLGDVRNYLRHSELSGYSVKETAELFRKEQEQAIVLELLDEGPDEGIDRDFLATLILKKTGWSIEKSKRLISDLYRDGKKIEVYMPDVDYAPTSTERELGSKKIEELKRIHRKDQFQGEYQDHFCEKCQRYHTTEHCPLCED